MSQLKSVSKVTLNGLKCTLVIFGTGIGDWGIGNGEWGMGNGEWGMGKWEIENTPVPGDDSIFSWATTTHP